MMKKFIVDNWFKLVIGTSMLLFSISTIIYSLKSDERIEKEDVFTKKTPSVNSNGIENFKKLHSILAADELFSLMVPADLKQFRIYFSDVSKLKRIHGILAADSLYCRIMPSDIYIAADKYGFGGLIKASGDENYNEKSNQMKGIYTLLHIDKDYTEYVPNKYDEFLIKVLSDVKYAKDIHKFIAGDAAYNKYLPATFEETLEYFGIYEVFRFKSLPQ